MGLWLGWGGGVRVGRGISGSYLTLLNVRWNPNKFSSVWLPLDLMLVWLFSFHYSINEATKRQPNIIKNKKKETQNKLEGYNFWINDNLQSRGMKHSTDKVVKLVKLVYNSFSLDIP